MLRTRTSTCLAAAVFLSLAACGGAGPVNTKDKAITAAKTALAGLPEAAGPFEVIREGDVWMVSAKAGPDSSASVSINAKTGKAVRLYADDGTDLSVIKPRK
jgi:hypothetical protein